MIAAMVRVLVPQPVRRKLRNLSLRHRLRSVPRRIVIGAGGTREPGWTPTEAYQLDLLDPQSWARYLEPNSVDALLAEHVWEHLTLEEAKEAAKLCHFYLRPGASIRVAVPDGLFPDPAYQEHVKVGGPGGGSDPEHGHKVVYTFRMLQEVFESAGFATTLLEYHDESHTLHEHDWDPADGMVYRSKRFDSRGAISIILDARK